MKVVDKITHSWYGWSMENNEYTEEMVGTITSTRCPSCVDGRYLPARGPAAPCGVCSGSGRITITVAAWQVGLPIR